MGFVKTALMLAGMYFGGRALWRYAQPRLHQVSGRLPRAQQALTGSYAQAVQAVRVQADQYGVAAVVSPGSVENRPAVIVTLPVGTTPAEIMRASQVMPGVVQGVAVRVVAK